MLQHYFLEIVSHEQSNLFIQKIFVDHIALVFYNHLLLFTRNYPFLLLFEDYFARAAPFLLGSSLIFAPLFSKNFIVFEWLNHKRRGFVRFKKHLWWLWTDKIVERCCWSIKFTFSDCHRTWWPIFDLLKAKRVGELRKWSHQNLLICLAEEISFRRGTFRG